MPSCLDNIVTIRDIKCPGNSVPSASGFDLMDAPEISTVKLNSIADEVYGTGMKLAQEKLKLATVMLQNDLIGFLAANRIAPRLFNPPVASGTFNTSAPLPGVADSERGFSVTLQRNARGGALRVLRIKTVKVYALQNATAAKINIAVPHPAGGGQWLNTFWTVDLIGGQINEFLIDHAVTASQFRVTLSDTTVSVASTSLNCSCNGSLPSGFGTIEGYNNGQAVHKEGFGIVAEMQQDCDYGRLLCDMAKGFTGELLWLKTRILILEEHLRSTRFNNWVIFGREDSEKLLAELRAEYFAKWQDFAGAAPNLLQAYSGDCIVCNGSKWVVNV